VDRLREELLRQGIKVKGLTAGKIHEKAGKDKLKNFTSEDKLKNFTSAIKELHISLRAEG